MIDWAWLWDGFVFFLGAFIIGLAITGLGLFVKFVWEWIADGGRHG